jgi:type IV secretory pathway TraG/TraD family ATPase VirD4
MNTMRQFGLSAAIIAQQLGDLEAIFGKRTGAFLNGAAWKIVFASDEIAVREYVEKLGGTRSVRVSNPTFSVDSNGRPNSGVSFPEQKVPLKAGYELGELGGDEMLLKIQGLPLMECKRKPYYECEDLNGKWDPDPYEVGQ